MADRLVKGVFSSTAEADPALEQLRRNFQSQRISVFGNEEDELFMLGMPTQKQSPTGVIILCGIVGLLVGALTGLWLTPVTESSAAAMPVLGSLIGACTGTILGIVLGVMAQLDSRQYDANVFDARLNKGKVLVVVRTHGHFEHCLAESIMDEHKARDIFAISIAENPVAT